MLRRIALTSYYERTLIVCAVIFFALFTTVGLMTHENFGTSAYDLGVFDQAYWRYGKFHGTFNKVLGFSILGDHFGILPIIFGPIYAIYPTIGWAIAAQALSVAVGGVILFEIARYRIPHSPVVALAIAFCYYLQPAVHSTLLWQYHEIGLASGIYMGLILSYVKSNRKIMVACLVALLLCREDMPFTVTVFGLFAILDKRWRDGVWAIGLAAIWWLFATKVAMPFFNGHGYWQTQPGRPLAPLLDNISNPSFYIERFSDRQSLSYLFQVMFPLGFLALWSPRHLIPALPTLLANVLIGNYKTQIGYHYSINIMPFVFWATIEALSRRQILMRLTEKRFALIFSSTIIVMSIIAYSQFSSLNLSQLPQMLSDWNNNAPKRQFFAELDREIGDKGIAASDFLLPQLAHRDRIYLFPNPWKTHYWGLAGENPHHPNSVDYVVVTAQMRVEQTELFDYLLSKGIFSVYKDELGIVVFKRIKPEAENRTQAVADYESFAAQHLTGFTGIAISPPFATPEEDFRTIQVDLASIQKAVPNGWKILPDPTPSQPMELTFGEDGKSDFHTIYVRSVVHLDHASETILDIGSDDGVTVWLNGLKVHENIVRRAAHLGDDELHLQFLEGDNVILFRVNNALGGWRLITRIRRS